MASLSDHCQRHISLLFADIFEVKVYMDNILLATGGADKDMTDDDLIAHACLVVKMIDRMTELIQLVGETREVFFVRDRIRTLGHVVSREGIALDPEKVTQVEEWPVPTSYAQLRAFLGFVGFLRSHIRGMRPCCVRP